MGEGEMFELSDRAKDYRERLVTFIEEHVYPSEAVYESQAAECGFDRIPPVLEELKTKAKSAGLWNLFLPDSERGAGLSNLEYAPLCEEMGINFWCCEVFNCNPPDTGNMEILERYATEGQKAQWLAPLLDGEIRSCFGMTEPDVASSDATVKSPSNSDQENTPNWCLATMWSIDMKLGLLADALSKL